MRAFSALLALTVALLAGCATTPTALPPISPTATDRSNPGQVIWHDLATRDLEIAQAFYGQLFGWKFEQISNGPRQYTLIRSHGETIGGMFLFKSEETDMPSGEWLLNLATTDADATAAAFVEAGGEIIEPARDVPGRGRCAFVRDDQDAVMVVTDSSSGDPAEGDVPLGHWLWNELWTHDLDQALAFYEGIFGYEIETMLPRPYALLSAGGGPVAGILQIELPEVRSHWVPFVRVLDVNATVEVARAMNAHIILPPDPAVRDGHVAVLQGPTGEPFVVQSYDFE